eukprot:TRINITY_DN3353_c0_g1_i3.p1 TRINITY_DN3353_c0_g1~~TRINITY_DN3353_c0_g1_i3.p1  ORF type:complete len:485 (-),score=199.67 TRINITY_DN3353_c0_g1_i3:93-1547(-)
MTASTDKPATPKKKDNAGKTNEEKINEIMADGATVVKMEVDYTEACDKKIPEAQTLAAKGKMNEAMELLFVLEKQTRSGADTHSTGRVLVTIVQLCFEAKEWNQLNEKIIDLVKKRAQLKQAVAKMVTECCTFLDKTPDKPTMMKLIDTLRTVTEGKIYVENERSRLTHRLAMIHEKDGNVTEAAKIMQELQVETYGSMERKEKVEMILEQMRLCLCVQDFIRAQIISKKISTRFFEDAKYADLKLKFYGYMIELGQHEGDYLDICKNYRQVHETSTIQEDAVQKIQTLKNVILYVALAKYDNEQSDLIHRVEVDKLLEEIPKYKAMVEKFTTNEIISQAAFCDSFEKELRDGVEGSLATDVFSRNEVGDKRWTDLKARIVEHNIRMMAKYYTKIRLTRMAKLLALTEAETEDCLSEMVVAGTVSAKTDRLEGIIDFTEQQDPLENLNSWSSNTNKLMDLVMKATHLINKEEMVHKHLAGGATE